MEDAATQAAALRRRAARFSLHGGEVDFPGVAFQAWRSKAPTVDFKTLSERLTHDVAYTQIHNVAGTPAMSAPLGMSQDGLPIGSQFAAAKGREDVLYALAYELEAAQPWATRTPDVWVG